MIGARLKSLRDSKDYTINQLCEKIGMNVNTYSKYERDERDVSTDTLCKLADFYGVTTDYLLGREEKNETIKQLSAEFALTETELKLLNNYIGLSSKQKATFNSYVKDVAKQLINGVTAEIKQTAAEPIKAAASMPTESQILHLGDKQPRELTKEEAKHVDFSQKPYFMTEE